MPFLPTAAHALHTNQVTSSPCARCGWHNPTPAAESLATLQPYTLGKPQHNEVTQACSSTRHAAATRYTLLH